MNRTMPNIEAITIIEDYIEHHVSKDSGAVKLSLALKMAMDILDKYRWHPIFEQPEKDGKYLVTIKYSTHKIIEIRSFSKDLYQVDKLDFVFKKGQSGWYGYDNDWGYYEQQDIIGWTELPDFYEDK